jgi:hypothetical protein
MNEREERLLKLLEQASAALKKTQEKLNMAEEVVVEWDEATPMVKRKTIEQWEQEVAELKEKEKMLVKREEQARAAFDRVVSQSNSIFNISASARYSRTD